MQNSDIPTLIDHRHHQHRNNIKSRNGNNHKDQQANHIARQLNRLIEIAMGLKPVAKAIAIGQLLENLIAKLAGIKLIVDLHAKALYLSCWQIGDLRHLLQ